MLFGIFFDIDFKHRATKLPADIYKALEEHSAMSKKQAAVEEAASASSSKSKDTHKHKESKENTDKSKSTSRISEDSNSSSLKDQDNQSQSQQPRRSHDEARDHKQSSKSHPVRDPRLARDDARKQRSTTETPSFNHTSPPYIVVGDSDSDDEERTKTTQSSAQEPCFPKQTNKLSATASPAATTNIVESVSAGKKEVKTGGDELASSHDSPLKPGLDPKISPPKPGPKNTSAYQEGRN